MFLSKRAKLILPPPIMLEFIFNWAKGVWARLIVQYVDDVSIFKSTKFLKTLKKDALPLATKDPFQIAVPIDFTNYNILTPPNLFIKAKIIEDEINPKLGQWLPNKTIVLYFKTPKYDFNTTLKKLKDTIAHELIHFVQEFLTPPSPEVSFGLPKKVLRNPNFYPSGRSKSTSPPLSHSERDIEFYPVLSNAARLSQRIFASTNKEDWPKIFRTLIAENPPIKIKINNTNYHLTPFHFFQTIKPNKKKWAKAVTILFHFLDNTMKF